MDRRDFLAQLALLVGAAVLPLAACSERAAPTPPPPPPAPLSGRTLDAHAWATIEAATARLVPTDDLPGAREANVVGYVDAQLALPHFAVFAREFVPGVAALDLLSAARSGVTFAAAPEAEQDAVLTALQDGEGSVEGFNAGHFFRILLALTLEGLLGDPVHGGNRDQAGWKLIGYVPGAPRPT